MFIGSNAPGIDQRDPGILEISDVARDQDQVVDDRGRGDKAVDVAARSERSDAAPFQGDPVGDRQDPIGMIMAQLLKPFRQAGGGLWIGFCV